MTDYQSMYKVLFQKVTGVIEELQNVQRQTEEMCISSEPTDIRNIDIDKTKDEKPDME
ncbi:hypothetical protein GOQ29_00475 [Clostridium sp. D2Q-14]|uniref:hypothetical protein n=1 Tax=Anaeromonas gelatinilytica TaxID=2683194 RepID=UPI00193B0AFA|nr:hypothetical protein [Anaeromonas gelatinilytica]MBS4534087.1 hypothetical protein [Anaeromonas gelatinilytica]